MIITDQNGISILAKLPKEGQLCQTKIKGNPDYHGNSKYTNGFFETYVELDNRYTITRWKADLWLPLENK